MSDYSMHIKQTAFWPGRLSALLPAAAWSAGVDTVLKAVLSLIFLLLTAPVAAHLIGRAAYRSGIKLSSATWVDHLEDDMQNKVQRNT